MSFVFNRLLLACVMLAALPGVAGAQEPSDRGVPLDGIAAVVNDGIVLRSALDQQVATVTQRFEQQGQALPPRNLLRQQVLERLVLQEIQVQRAARLGIKVSDEQLNETLADIARRNGIQFADLPAALESQGINYARYREEVRQELTLNLLRQRDVYSRIYVSPREIEQCMERRKNAPEEDMEYDLAHILVSIPASATPEQAEERAVRAQGIYDRARAGEDFAQLAAAYSDAGTALDGGALGWRRANQLPSVAAAVIVGMQPGDVSEPIRTPTGLHIFKLRDRRSAASNALVQQVHVRHILMETTAVEDDDTVRQKLLQFRERILKGEDFSAIASVNSDDAASAASGGDLGWVGPGTFVPAFEKVIDGLQVDEISQPFKTQYGWHLAQLLGRRTYDATDDVIRNRCVAQLRESRAEEETEIWMRRLRDEAFVEYRL
jgi:peptidyl-prolyl cis-trans isomerase SurA